MIVVLMGVSGSGKTLIGTLLAKGTGATFADADDYHSAQNKQKMHDGHPLTDEDRQPWLERLNGVLRGWYKQGTSGVMACSALKESYRQTLSAGMPDRTVSFCYLEVSREVLQKRLEERNHEFMTPKLLDSQLATLEVPHDAILIHNEGPPEEVVADVLSKINGN